MLPPPDRQDQRPAPWDPNCNGVDWGGELKRAPSECCSGLHRPSPQGRGLRTLPFVEHPQRHRQGVCGGYRGGHSATRSAALTPLGVGAVWGRGAVVGAVECRPLQAAATQETQARGAAHPFVDPLTRWFRVRVPGGPPTSVAIPRGWRGAESAGLRSDSFATTGAAIAPALPRHRFLREMRVGRRSSTSSSVSCGPSLLRRRLRNSAIGARHLSRGAARAGAVASPAFEQMIATPIWRDVANAQIFRAGRARRRRKPRPEVAVRWAQR